MTMRIYHQPGIPPSPPILFDRGKREATVELRYANWRSYGWATLAAQVLSALLTLFVCGSIWVNARLGWDAVPVLIVVFPFGLVLWAILNKLCHENLRRPLARWVFGYRTVFWFTNEILAVRSPLYSKGIKLWRNHGNARVHFDFFMMEDHVAKGKIPPDPRRPQPMEYRRAEIMYVVVSKPNESRLTHELFGTAIKRGIPLVEIDSDTGSKLTMILAAALAITAGTRVEETQGNDIDSGM